MRVLPLVGTHGTGKTTLAGTLSVRCPVGYGREVAREVIRLFGFQSADDYRTAGNAVAEIVQEAIFRVQVLRERRAHLTPRLWIWDRSVLDPVAYAGAYGVKEELVRRWREEALDHAAKHYPLMIYIPPVIPLEGDGFRSTNVELRKQVNDLLVDMLGEVESRGVRVHRLRAVTLDARVHEVGAAMVAAGVGCPSW